LSLRGFSETPERDIVKLLESGLPIEPDTRMELAAALRGQFRATLPLRGVKQGARYCKLADLQHAFAKEFDSWLAALRSDGDGWERYANDAQELAFLLTDAMGEDPMRLDPANRVRRQSLFGCRASH
jgi:hypothetical protein